MVHPVRMRADARRNRDRILAAARELLPRRGTELTMDELAAAAGVAVGTLYRHVPTKQDLVAAVVEDGIAHLATLAETAVAAIEATSAGDGARREEVATRFDALLRAVAARHAEDRAVKDAATQLGQPVSPDLDAAEGSVMARATGAFEAVLAHARDAGVVRADCTLTDLVALIDVVPPGADDATRDRLLDVVLHGLRPPTDG